jgi:hypothetical protein
VADILEFQVDMLEDDALAVAAYEVISVGITADRAWRLALDVEIAGYRAAEDEYFLARAADIVDIRIRARWPGEGIVGCSGAHSGAALGNLITSRGLVFRLQPKNESCSIAASRKSIAAGESALVYPAKFQQH